MAGIEVDLTDEGPDGYAFRVDVVDGGRETRHHVTCSTGDFERLARPGEEPEAFMVRCFEFLVERESGSSILPQFDVSLISQYFPEFVQSITAPPG